MSPLCETAQTGAALKGTLNAATSRISTGAVIEGPQGLIVLPLGEMKASQNGDVQWSKSKDKLQQAQSYEKTQYQPIVLDQPLSKFSASN